MYDEISSSTPKAQVVLMPGSIGILMVLAILAFGMYCPFMFTAINDYNGKEVFFNGDIMDFLAVPIFLLGLILTGGFCVIEPKQAKVLVFFGKTRGVVMENGFFWMNPLLSKTSVSLKIENFESAPVKVNDKTGSPIMAAAVVSCQVVDPEAYAFNADNPTTLVMNAIDRVLRRTVSRYAYDLATSSDGNEHKEPCLRDDSDHISAEFKSEMQSILTKIGMEVLDANFTNLSYAPEIASVMLQRQQAAAMMDARQMLVKGAVTVVQDAIAQMEKGEGDKQKVTMSEAQKGQLASNLLTVLVSERGAQVTIPLS
ncbi:SPFH domain-containing protein [Pseudomonas amygdali]|uniref:SPFH domain-containing protein n=2 Tax=Pseudomonas amygdali pv. lachrymans TaxID=53707 RepID=A0AAD0PW97_PSEAV|nr:SPFH domain-containing protein [Pseudomonas amygdali]AXH59897.1 SPFH domain-containing protein [Pseudomonas amygdali pv. lachrymans str. M301315]RMT06053.1 Band 7 protein [Pseudomonas amygdali pv. lachrymans]